jgi:hypothetical protein
VLVRRTDRRWRIGIISERGRGRSREQATTTTTAAGEPLAGVAFFVEDMECRQTNLGNFLLAQCNFVSHSCVRDSTSAAGVLLAPYAPLASVNDNPAAPKTGTALIRRSALEACFARDM